MQTRSLLFVALLGTMQSALAQDNSVQPAATAICEGRCCNKLYIDTPACKNARNPLNGGSGVLFAPPERPTDAFSRKELLDRLITNPNAKFAPAQNQSLEK